MINTASVPRPVAEDMADLLIHAVSQYFDRPGVEDDFQRWLEAREKRLAAQAAGKDERNGTKESA